ncbi:YaiI/YqxD family protein [Longirhabdus pacifica]|uniref:YaiI/YqxD family protein n=1 Tax=Longirhabdus pacifica TaxID=2305227 RepID=UPI001008B1EA|nr:YaiI/YqxD family protein [Longirhabdus pacifica]
MVIKIEQNSSIIIYVDADACPVKQEIIETAQLFSATVKMVASYNHLLEASPHVELIQVDASDQSADLYIANAANKQCIVITQDLGLAALAISKKSQVISFRGSLYHVDNIDRHLVSRHEKAKLRRRKIYTKGPKPFDLKDRINFQQSLTKVLKKMQEKE